MCLTNLNATVLLFDKVSNRNTLADVFNQIKTEKNGTEYSISFTMLICLSAILPNEDSDTGVGDIPGNIIEREKEYEVKIRLNHVDSAMGWDIDTFVFSTFEYRKLCRDVCEFQRFIRVNNLVLPSVNTEYEVKVLVREKDQDKWIAQTIHGFYVISDD